MNKINTKILKPTKHLRPQNYNFNLLYDKPLDNKYRIKFPHKLDRRSQKISCIEDSMFKTLIFSNARIKYSCKLLSLLLDISYEELLNNLKLDKNSLDKLKKKDKNQNVDYVGKIYDTYINIEMNNSQDEKYMKRNLLYLINLLTRKNKESINDYEATKLQVIQVSINNFAFSKFCDTIYIHTVNNKYYSIDRSDNIIVIEIFLPNIVKKWKEEGIEKLNYLERLLLVYMLYDIKDCREIGKDDEFMNEFIDDSKNASNDDYLLAAYNKEEETRDAIREQAMDEEKVEMIKNMHKANISMAQIKKVTGFTTQQIKNICL